MAEKPRPTSAPVCRPVGGVFVRAMLRPLAASALVVLLSASAGCHPAAIAVFFGQDPLIPAEYSLTRAPLLVLIEEDTGLGGRTAVRYRYQMQKTLIEEFRKNKVNEQVIPDRQVLEYESAHPRTAGWSAAALGKAMRAEQVLHIQLLPFSEDSGMLDPTNTLNLAASVRVVDVHSRSQVWPVESEGHTVVFSLMAPAMHSADSNTDLNDKDLAIGLAERIARLFYEHRIKQSEAARREAEAHGLK